MVESNTRLESAANIPVMTPVQELVFLQPGLEIDETLLGKLQALEKIVETCSQSVDLESEIEADPAVAELLTEQTNIRGDIVSSITWQAELFSDQLARLLGPGKRRIGENNYLVEEGVQGRLWLHLLEPDTGRKIIFNRHTEITKTEHKSGLAIPKINHHVGLILDVHAEQQQAAGMIPLTPETQKRLADKLEKDDWPKAVVPSILPNTYDSADRYPYHSEKIASATAKFNSDYQDLLAKGQGMLVQFGWNENEGAQAIGSPNCDNITIFFDSRQLINSHHLPYPGHKRYAWQIVRHDGQVRTVSGIELSGSMLRPLPRTRYDSTGSLRAIEQLTKADVEELWTIITAGVNHRIFEDRVREMRNQPPLKMDPDSPEIRAVAAMIGRSARLTGDEIEATTIDAWMHELSQPDKRSVGNGFVGELIDLDAAKLPDPAKVTETYEQMSMEWPLDSDKKEVLHRSLGQLAAMRLAEKIRRTNMWVLYP